jgi:hypothetical protein
MRIFILLSIAISGCQTDPSCMCESGAFFPGANACREVYFVRNPCETLPIAEVCGCDGNTYISACYANLAGVKVVSQGRCE